MRHTPISHSSIGLFLRVCAAVLAVVCAGAGEFQASAAESEATAVQAPAKKTATRTKKKTPAKKKASKAAESKAPKKEAAPAPKKTRTPVVRGNEVLQLKAKKDNETGLYGYENVGDKYYWWAEAHFMGSGKDQLNQGHETQWVITPQYTKAAKEFSEGLAAVEYDGKVGFIDMNNRFIIPPVFEPMDDLAGFKYGLSAVKKDGKYGFIDKGGLFVHEPVFDDAENFNDDCLAAVKIGKKFGCIDLTGDTVVPFDYAAKEIMTTLPLKNKPYREARKRAKARHQQGHYDAFLEIVQASAMIADRQIRDANFTEAPGSKAPEGAVAAGDGFYITTNKAGLAGASDSYGRRIIPCVHKSVRYDAVQRLFIVEDGRRAGADDGSPAVGIASTAGGWIIPPVFDKVGDFDSEGYAPVSVGQYSGRVNVLGLVDDAFMQSLLQASIEEKDTRYTRRLLGILPTCAPAHNCLGIYYASEHDNLKDAIHHFTVAHRLDPENEDFKANMKAAKGERNSRRWNRVLTGMTIAATVLSVGAVTYSAVKGAPMQSTSFASSDGGSFSQDFSAGDFSSGESGSSSNKRRRESASASTSGSDNRSVSDWNAIRTLDRVYGNYESMVIDCNVYPEKHKPGDKREYQNKMREIRLKLKNKYNYERSQSQHETN